jgi:membrane protein DedA with SNARE-associated domain
MMGFEPSHLWLIQEFIRPYGLWVVFALVMLECIGIPVPAETALIATSLYAGSTHQFSEASVVAVAATAAILGDNIGYLIGCTAGVHLIMRYGRFLRLNHARLKVGQYLFLRHGGKIVFFGRFVAILRTYSAILAGVNMMRWPHFLVMNAAGGTCWAFVFGTGAYRLGENFTRIAASVGSALFIAAIVLVAAGMLFFRNHEKQLERRAAKVLHGTWPHTFTEPEK